MKARKTVIVAALVGVVGFGMGTGLHHHIERVTMPVRCAIVQRINPARRCDGIRKLEPKKLKQPPPGWNEQG